MLSTQKAVEVPSRYTPIQEPDVQLNIETIRPGLQTPAFLDHSLVSRAVNTRYLTIDEFALECETYCVYLFTVYTANGQRPGTCTFRYTKLEAKPSLVIADEIFTDREYISDIGQRAKKIQFMLLHDHLEELAAVWGIDEVHRQLGKQLLVGVNV